MLKSFLALLVAVAAPADVRADCSCGSALLTSTVLEGASRLVLETSCAPEVPKITIEDAAGKLTPFRIVATHVGYESAQYEIVPLAPLARGTYKVVFHRWQREAHELRVATPTPAMPPVLASATVTSQKQQVFGCGPARSVVVDVGTSASLAYVELIDAGTKRQTTGFVRVANGTLTIGHGMCSGSFALGRGRGYTASITLLAPEHGTTSTSKSLSFTYSP